MDLVYSALNAFESDLNKGRSIPRSFVENCDCTWDAPHEDLRVGGTYSHSLLPDDPELDFHSHLFGFCISGHVRRDDLILSLESLINSRLASDIARDLTQGHFNIINK